MRFFTTCLLLFCFQSFVVCTLEDGAIAFVKEINISNKETTVVSKNITTETVTVSTFEWVDINHHRLTDQLLPAVVAAKLSSNTSIKLSTIKVFRTFINHSYHFIFGCLYPKHNFW